MLLTQQTPPIYLSQSEGGDWQGCPARAWARFFLGYRPPDDEDRPRRVGSMGHAVLNDRIAARFAGRDDDPSAAVAAEAERRGWSEVDPEEFDCAREAAARVADHLRLDSLRILPDLYSDGAGTAARGPMSEVRLRVGWQRLVEFFTDDGRPSAHWRDIYRCDAVRARFAGIEGQPDLVCMPEGVGGGVAVLDFKFRQSPDLGGSGEPDEAAVPDKQAAWYLALLHSAGLRPAGGLEFWQVNAYAGRLLTAEDFLRISDGGAESEEEAALVTDRGLPTRDLNRYKDARAFVTAEVWGAAFEALADRRLAVRLADWRKPKFTDKGNLRKPGPAPDRLSYAEQNDAREWLYTLEATSLVAVRRFRGDLCVSREVVRDLIVAVDGPLSHALCGITPARHLQTHRTSPCARQFGGCPVRTPCLATIGSGNFEATLRDLRAQGALVEHATGPRLGVVPQDFNR